MAGPASPWRRRLLHARRWLLRSAVVALILLATVVGTASQLLPLVERHPERVAAWLGDRAGRPVAFDGLQAEWTRRGPLLGLSGLRIGEGGDALQIAQAQLLVSIYSVLVPGRPVTELRIDGLALALHRDAEGRWTAAGLDDGGEGDAQAALDALEGLGEIQVLNAALAVSVADNGEVRRWSLPRVDLRLRAGGGRMRLGVMGYSAHDASPLVAVADLDRRRGDGRIDVRAEGLDLAAWSGDGGWLGLHPTSGRGTVAARVTLAGQRVTGLEGGLQLEGVRLAAAGEGASMRAEGAASGPMLDRLRVDGVWRADERGWGLDLPLLQLQVDGQAFDFGRLRGAAEGDRQALAIDRIHLEPLGRVAPLLEPLPPALREWLDGARPQGRLEDVAVRRAGGRLLASSATVAGLGFEAAGQAPGASGIDGALAFDHDGARLQLDAARIAFDWRLAFGELLPVTLDGDLALWRDGAGWSAGGDGLRVQGEDYSADARVELRFQPGGGRPWLAVAADVGPAPVTAANRFWVRHLMPGASVEWLEAALGEGRLVSGRAVLAGDLDDWPFANGEGVFEAVGELEGVNLAFSPDWPAAEAVSGEARFSGVGMSVEARGRINGIEVASATARIPDWSAAVLDIQARGAGSGAQLLGLLRASPVQEAYGEALEGLSLEGRGQAAVSLSLPLGDTPGTPGVRGTVDLSGARVVDAARELAFDSVTGRLRFTGDGFAADELSVRGFGGMGSLSIAVGGATSDAQRIAEASLRGTFDVQALLARVDGMDWLGPKVSGEGEFNIGLRVPRQDDDSAGTPLLTVRSDLVGIDLGLPAPLRKRPRVALPLRLETALPVEAGELSVRLGGLMHLRGRLDPDAGFAGRLALGMPAEPLEPGDDRVHVGGQVAVLDAGGWVALVADTVGGEGPTLRLGEVELYAGQLDLLDRAFIETRLRVVDTDEGLVLSAQGPEISGSLQLPADRDAAVVGRFERLYWPAGREASAGGEATDPAAVPPLDFDVADLRFGEAALGRARLLTYPTPEGMQVERLSTDSPDIRLDAVGSWSRIGERDFSRFSLSFQSADLGRMLATLGYAGLVEGGPTQASLVAGWAGSPAAFSLEVVEGELQVEVGPGRILEVEPGAGRLLGLVSLAELPRRLSLDFSDFFGQGFGFNTIAGGFTIAGGVARTDGLRIDGPAAQINISGGTALAGQTYDQTVEVLPKTGGVLPVVGAITGGPAGAAVGAMAQAIFNQPFRQAARVVYRVTGPWSAPEIEVIERGPAPRPPAAPAGPGGGRAG